MFFRKSLEQKFYKLELPGDPPFTLHLRVKGGVSVGELPPALQKLMAEYAGAMRNVEVARSRAGWDINSTIKAIAERENLTTEEVSQRIFEGKKAEKSAETAEGSAIVVSESRSPMEYFKTYEEFKSLTSAGSIDGSDNYEFQEVKLRLQKAIASVMLSSRMALTVEGEYVANSGQLSVPGGLLIALNPGDKIKFEEPNALPVTLIVSGHGAQEGAILVPVEPFPQSTAGVGFLLNPAGSKRVGFEWKEEYTDGLLTTQLDPIHDFFIREKSGIPHPEFDESGESGDSEDGSEFDSTLESQEIFEDPEAATGNESPSSMPDQTPPSSTGKTLENSLNNTEVAIAV